MTFGEKILKQNPTVTSEFYWEALITQVFGEGIQFDKQTNAFIASYKLLETYGFPSLQATLDR